MENEEPNLLQDIYDYLRTQFSDLETAKVFLKSWVLAEDDIPARLGMYGCTTRAMCAHISNVLENKEPDTLSYTTNYSNTKYGPDLVYYAWDLQVAKAMLEDEQ